MKKIFKENKPIIGMVHLSALPGTIDYEDKSIEEIIAEAVEDAKILNETGFDGILFQNTNDIPSLTKISPETVAIMTRIGSEIKKVIDIPLGVNIHKVDAKATLAVAHAIGADFVRLKVYAGAVVDVQGIINGVAEEALNYRKKLGSNCAIWSDIYDITSWPLTNQPIEEVAHWALKFGKSDSLIITGFSFDETMDRVKKVKAYNPNADIIIGGGINHNNIEQALVYADAIIIGSALETKRFTRPISFEKAKDLMDIVKSFRNANRTKSKGEGKE